jgi:hypothetical protein
MTFRRILEQVQGSTGLAKKQTNARVIACEDIRNAVSIYSMNAFMVPLSHPAVIINYDSTQFMLGGQADEKVFVVNIKDEKRPKSVKTSVLQKDNSLVCYFIKWFCIINACGDFASPP